MGKIEQGFEFLLSFKGGHSPFYTHHPSLVTGLVSFKPARLTIPFHQPRTLHPREDPVMRFPNPSHH